jgi:thiamine-monophosphate kinase
MLKRGIGEAEAIALIARIARRRRPEIAKAIGDDAALFRDGLVVTTDTYLEGVHFDRSYLDLSAVGARAMCGTLSDIAAMCAKPIAVFVSAMIPSSARPSELRELYQGMDAVCSLFDTEIAGGDIVAAPKLGLALTALGRTSQPRLRSAARPGDYLYVTGHVALAETGRLALKHALSPTRYKHAIERHVCPLPRINEALKLARKIRGLIDTSDGLSTDAGHLAIESKVRIIIEPERLPLSPETCRLASELNLDLGQFAVSSGEDYELLFTSPDPRLETVNHKGHKVATENTKELGLPPRKLGDMTRTVRHSCAPPLVQDAVGRSAAPDRDRVPYLLLTRIGRVEEGSGVYLLSAGRLRRLKPSGYDHLR